MKDEDRRKEGLKVLASMIADAIRRGIPPGNGNQEPLVSEDEIIKGWELDDEGKLVYTETCFYRGF